jgi:hypothetical protein
MGYEEGRRRGHGGAPGYAGFSWWVAAVVAVAAAATGVLVALLLLS